MTRGLTRRTGTKPQQRMRPVMLHDWVDVTMLHFAVPPRRLQPHVPYELDVHPIEKSQEPAAWISLVFFTLRNMRLPWARTVSRILMKPMSDHQFLNVRTYVKHSSEPGIFFMHEWLNNHLSVLLGAATFGLPYHHATFEDEGVRRGDKRLTVSKQPQTLSTQVAAVGSLDAFLLERYTAFTQWRGIRRCFRIRHDPWPQRRVDMTVTDASLVHALPFWPHEAKLMLAHTSPGVTDVEISRPYVLGFAA